MKTLIFQLITLLVAFAPCFSIAQTALPYYTGFDSPSQQAGWQQFREGTASPENWSVVSGGTSAPMMLSHDYPVGNTSTDTVLDWYVSPPFDFSDGGHIDSLKIKLYSITGNTTADDHFGIYLLQDAANPEIATSVTLLADLTHMASDSTIWRDTGNFAIPAIPGTCYIALKYRATNDWFVPDIDNIHISGAATSVTNANKAANEISLFPNPATNTINLRFPDEKGRKLFLYNAIGICVKEQGTNATNMSFDISALPAGAYYIAILQGGNRVNTVTWLKN